MTVAPVTHHHIVGSTSAGRWQLFHRYGVIDVAEVISCHRRRRGPYSGGGQLVRRIVDDVSACRPDVLDRRLVEIFTVAPDLRGQMASPPETLTSLAVPAERTRYYSRTRTWRIANGLAELALDWADIVHPSGVTVALDDVDLADATDQELLAVLLRRLNPRRLRLLIGSGPELDPVQGSPEPSLPEALRRHAQPIHTASTIGPPSDEPDAGGLAYIEQDGTSDDPAVISAYAAMSAEDRASAHDDRAERLISVGDPGLLLGAVPYHREHGTDPSGLGARALADAGKSCLMHGFYDASLDLGRRVLALVDPDVEFDRYWGAVARMGNALAALGRSGEAEKLYHDVRALSADSELHMNTAYGLAMLYTRHHEEDRRDERIAMEYINQSLAIAELLPDPAERAFNAVFAANGRALIEVHRRRLSEALRLVDDGLDRLDRELGPGAHQLHRSVLRYNRAQVHAGLGSLEAALADYDAVIEVDPYYPEYHFDRAGLLRRLGKYHDALGAYNTAIRLSPPFPELHYNRGDVLAELGDTEAAIADFRYVLELSPDHVDALVNLVGLLQACGQTADTIPLVERGLTLEPRNPHLLCALGEVRAAEGRWDDALSAYDRAVRLAPDLPAALAARAVVAFDAGRATEAVENLTQALGAGEDSALLFNRGVALQSLGQHESAVSDFTRALELDDTDADDIRDRRAVSRRALGGAD